MRWKRILLALVTIPIAILAFLLLFAEWAWGYGYVKPSLDPQYVPMAEYLLQNPEPAVGFIDVNPPPGSTIQSGVSIEVLILTSLKTPIEMRDEINRWTHIFINNQRISGKDFGIMTWAGGLSLNAPRITTHFEFTPNLNPGIHTFEIQVGKSVMALLNPAEAVIYKWAYRVE